MVAPGVQPNGSGTTKHTGRPADVALRVVERVTQRSNMVGARRTAVGVASFQARDQPRAQCLMNPLGERLLTNCVPIRMLCI